MDMHEWFRVSWNDVNVNRDDVVRKFTVHVWRVEQIRNNVLNYSILKKILLLRKQCAFENDSSNLLTIYTRNWRFRLNSSYLKECNA